MVSLYRRSLRVIGRVIETKEDKARLNVALREEFEKRRGMDRKNLARIEYLLRKGEKQLEMLSAQGSSSMVTGVRFVRADA